MGGGGRKDKMDGPTYFQIKKISLFFWKQIMFGVDLKNRKYKKIHFLYLAEDVLDDQIKMTKSRWRNQDDEIQVLSITNLIFFAEQGLPTEFYDSIKGRLFFGFYEE